MAALMLLPLVVASASSTVDLLGRVTAVVHEDGTTSAYAYDMLSRVVSRSGVGLAESWSYDASGRPLAAARGGVALAWSYDAFGRVSTETRDGRGVTATRDADGRLASFSAPGIAQSFAYDAAGRLTTVAVPGQADAYVAYDRSGLESWRLARAGGSDVLRTDLHRDAAGRPLEVAATSSSGAQAGLLRTLDPEGAPLTQVDQSGKGWSFSRDLGTRELLGAQEIGGGSASVATGYDLSGLRATHSDLLASGAWSTNAAGETSQARGRPVVNDLLGRVTSLDGWNHTYSCDGLLLSSEPSAPAEGSRRSVHAYDALGRRVRTTVQAYVGGQWVAFSTTERDFLGRLPLGIETSFADGSAKSWRFMRGPDASGTLEGAGGARGVLAVLKDASSWKAVAADTLGNVLALAGVNGDFTRRTFDPWGNPLTRDAAGSLRASTLSERRADYDALPLAWASQEVDPDTGLTHYHFREYSPSLGGWLTRDPIGLAGGYLNLRSYLGNRPADHLDQWGEFWGAVIGAGVDLFVQTVVEGKSLSEVNYYRVAASAVIGLATGGASALVSRGASAAGASLAGRIAGQAMVGAAASVTQNAVVNIDHGRPLAENAGKAAIAGALIAGAMEPLMEGAGAITDAVTEAYSEARIGISLIRESSKSGGANAVAAEVSVAENATARAAAQAEASTLDKVKLPCAEAEKTIHQIRRQYFGEVLALEELGLSARSAGADSEVVARMLVAERNALKVKYRELSPADFVKQAEARNVEKYGNPLGPTADQLRAQGKTWEQIIDSAARPGGKDLGL